MSYSVGGTAEVSTEYEVISQQTTDNNEQICDEHTNRIHDLVLNHRENGRKLARSLLRRWRARMNPQEVDSIVDVTLCEAAKRFSPEHGASFMTFFFYHLRGSLVRAISQAVNSGNLFLALSEQFGNDSRHGAISEEMLRNLLPECASFGTYEMEGPEYMLLRKENVRICREACAQLDALEQEVIVRSFEKEEPLVSIARSLGYSRCHISRVKKRALQQLSTILGAPDNTESSQVPDSGLTSRPNAKLRQPTTRRSRRRNIRTRQFMSSEETSSIPSKKRA